MVGHEYRAGAVGWLHRDHHFTSGIQNGRRGRALVCPPEQRAAATKGSKHFHADAGVHSWLEQGLADGPRSEIGHQAGRQERANASCADA